VAMLHLVRQSATIVEALQISGAGLFSLKPDEALKAETELNVYFGGLFRPLNEFFEKHAPKAPPPIQGARYA
ncbi:MAG TPA: hypothetical protein VHF22_14905, partial [Planctomycetota bacterium]|nr:hypothetical protein [Planctomycetota bacterium]